jgi:hypothetical protein
MPPGEPDPTLRAAAVNAAQIARTYRDPRSHDQVGDAAEGALSSLLLRRQRIVEK